MGLVNLITIVFIIAMVACYAVFIQNTRPVVMGAKQQMSWINIGIVLLVGLVVRYILACIDKGYEVDMNCFSYWSDMAYRVGFKKFYTSDVFVDYPPGYIYIAYILGALRSWFPTLASSSIIIKMPAMLCDLAAGALIYKIAHKHFDEMASILFTCFYIFNPVILIDSAMWGQVDSVFTFFVVLMVYFVAEKKLIPAIIVFGIGSLVKPQAIVLTPVLGIGILDQVFFNDFKWKKFWIHLGTGIGTIALMFVAIIPYGYHPISNVSEKTPQTVWQSAAGENAIYFDFTTNLTEKKSMLVYNQAKAKDQVFYLEESADNTNWTPITVNDQGYETEPSKFVVDGICTKITFTSAQPYLRMRTDADSISLNEVEVMDGANTVIVPANGATYPQLFDEYEQYAQTNAEMKHWVLFEDNPVFHKLGIFQNAGMYCPAFAQYMSTLTSYPFATVNAYNFWGAFGLNWHSQYEKALGMSYQSWGTIFIIVICLAILGLCILNRKKDNGAKYFYLGAFVAAGFFTMSVRVHERYMFPAFVLLLCAFLYKPRKEYLYIYIALTLAQVNNIWHAFKYYDASNFDWDAKFPRVIGAAHVLIFAYMIYVAIRVYVLESKVEETEENAQETIKIVPSKQETPIEESKYFAPRSSEKNLKFTKFDWIAMVAITVIYASIALFNLGDKDAPQTYWETSTQGDCITLDMSNKTSAITKMAYYDGRYETREYFLEESADGVNWTLVSVNGQDINTLGEEAAKVNMSSVFCWGSATFYSAQPYLRLRLNSGEAGINELVFFDEAGNIVVPNNASDYQALFDEQEKYPAETTFHDSTYFDEIYHGRTGYEMTRGLYNYEWTHPPLGKFFISIGIRIFGMCPFGWRIMGTLFGIAMLPIFYLLSRRIFRKTSIATLTTILFAADFMHFTQTRIATIDVFVTFFIILMYYFMYKYYRMSFYDTDVKKTWIPLFCCGVSMGLGCASKWPGVYAGLGLAVLFFLTVGRRFMEYRYACMHPTEETNGILHEDVIRKFRKNLLMTLGICCIAFVLIPGTIYTLSYIPFNNGTDMGLIQRMLKNQVDMWNYHSKLDATHPFSSCWYEWPIIKRPIWYFTVTLSNGLQENISAFGNPLVWWAGIPAFVYMLYRVLRHKDRKSLFLSVAYMAQLLPWVGVTRCTFIYHYFPSVPFITLMSGYAMYQICDRKTEKGRKIALICCCVYVAAAIGLFIMFYPVLSGYPIDESYGLKYLRWFKSWVLVSG